MKGISIMETNGNGRASISDYADEGKQAYSNWRERLLSTPENRAMYEEEAAKKQIWLQLVEARQASGLTQKQVAERLGVSQAQVARLEKQGYDSYTLRSLQRYLEALGGDYRLDVTVHRVTSPPAKERAAVRG